MKYTLIALVASLSLGSAAQAANYILGASQIGGAPLANFEGKAEGLLIDTQYAGVTFSQPDGGKPQIDNSPFLFGYQAASGTGVLTGSMSGGAPFPTVAGIIATFATPVSGVEAFMSDTAPLGNYNVTIFGAGNVVLETVNFTGASIQPGAYVGFTRGSADIFAIQFGPSVAFGDAFAIDDLRTRGSGVPDGGNTLVLLALGLISMLAIRRKA
ncbi:MAG: VPDSG-CTERM sorting domain-containing protein [Opitutaceae bacterium]|nr:VPDSG-CTERM sorting domain-containing protein [Opitutaceae bacterium]